MSGPGRCLGEQIHEKFDCQLRIAPCCRIKVHPVSAGPAFRQRHSNAEVAKCIVLNVSIFLDLVVEGGKSSRLTAGRSAFALLSHVDHKFDTPYCLSRSK